ncbi:endonuclease 4 [Flexistipes sinusarabici DSM 4947]|uniref:Probable endonuclease 4 n=1 Tax=Flexistipes sinusarabici (strain ATCC 49648 / DSM 4947 / MAS 10) TaxID=717231 RepID=F8E8E1_FLESM|nr:deoxyribonuclease IV [Flexistipes sinusarabici]AEI15138.1 endonuclease 4 [Flexistipes sinusarabici DSM 4947]
MYVGAHESIAGEIHKSIDRALTDECESMQVFVKNANRWQGKKISGDEAEKFRKKAEKLGHNKICAHSSYLINMATEKKDLYKKSFESLKDELGRCDALGIPYYVIHPGSHTGIGEEKGLNNIIALIDNIYGNNDFNCMMLLETTAGQGTNLGYDIRHLKYIIDSSKYPDKLGVCLDSCHMFAAGYDFKNDYENVVNETFRLFGDKVKVFHLNDTKFDLGSKRDRHEMIGEGFLGEEFFRKVLNDKHFSKTLGILETPLKKDESYKPQIRYLKSLRR